jgi:CubicO group peptidase (beta-lactamase class C family)
VAYASRTDGQAVLVMHQGRIVHEAYVRGGGASNRQMLASGSKSFVGVATLAAVHDGLLRLDQPVSELLPEWRREVRQARVTVRQLLSLESGVETGNPGTGCGGPRAMWSAAVNARSVAEPGSRFAYGPYPFIAMGVVIERLRRTETFESFLARRILTPLGITVEWRARCADGRPQLAGGAAMTARDWATFGEFIRRGGVHGSTRLLPDSLVRQLFRPSTVNPAYGMSWWLREAAFQEPPALGLEGNAQGTLRGRLMARRARQRANGASDRDADSAWVPRDLVMAAGAGKQRLYVIPSRELVVVRLGPLLGGREFRDAEFLAQLLGPSR